MPRKTTLRSVAADESALRAVTPKTVTDAVQSGNPRDALVALQARLARAIDNDKTPGQALAALSRRLMDVRSELEALDAAAEQEALESEDVPDEDWEAI